MQSLTPEGQRRVSDLSQRYFVSTDAVMTLLGQLHADGATLVMVTHDPRHARMAERVVRMVDGRVVEPVGAVA